LRTPRALSSAIARSTARRGRRSRPGPASCSWPAPRLPRRKPPRNTSATSASSAPSTAAMAPVPAGTAACIRRPRSRTSFAASASDSAPAATSAAYSPRLWPAKRAGCAPPAATHARQAATSAASSAGCVNSVWLSCSSGPCMDSVHRSTPQPAEASSKVARTRDARRRVRRACRGSASPGRGIRRRASYPCLIPVRLEAHQ
jgi:hypothetical protein